MTEYLLLKGAVLDNSQKKYLTHWKVANGGAVSYITEYIYRGVKSTKLSFATVSPLSTVRLDINKKLKDLITDCYSYAHSLCFVSPYAPYSFKALVSINGTAQTAVTFAASDYLAIYKLATTTDPEATLDYVEFQAAVASSYLVLSDIHLVEETSAGVRLISFNPVMRYEISKGIRYSDSDIPGVFGQVFQETSALGREFSIETIKIQSGLKDSDFREFMSKLLIRKARFVLFDAYAGDSPVLVNEVYPVTVRGVDIRKIPGTVDKMRVRVELKEYAEQDV